MNSLRQIASIRVPRRNRGILPPDLRAAYDGLEAAVLSFSDRASLPGDPRRVLDNVQALWMAVRLDHPGVFWTGSTFTLIESDPIGFSPSYTMGPSEAEAAAGLLLSEVRRVEKALAVTRDPLSVAVSVHDHLASSVEYDMDAPHASDALGALVDRTAVCQGISAAASLMLNYAGVPCDTYFGKIRSSPEVFHAWNVIPYGRGRLHMDITNDLGRPGRLSHMHALMDEPAAHAVLSWMGEVGQPSGTDYYRAAGLYAGSPRELAALAERFASSGAEYGEFEAPGMSREAVGSALLSAYGRGFMSFKHSPELGVFSFDVSGQVPVQ